MESKNKGNILKSILVSDILKNAWPALLKTVKVIKRQGKSEKQSQPRGG